jgi:hypothetical protein
MKYVALFIVLLGATPCLLLAVQPASFTAHFYMPLIAWAGGIISGIGLLSFLDNL